MTYVVLHGEPDLAALFGALKPTTEYRPEGVLKTRNAFLARDNREVVVDAAAVENGVSRPFFALVSLQEHGLEIRIHPTSEVEETTGVKRTVAMVADQLVMLDPQLEVAETDLKTFLSASRAPA